MTATASDKATEFVRKHGRDAVRIQRETGLNAAFILTHAALESGYGKSAPGNMFFGVKAGKSWKGKRQLLRTWEATKDGVLHLQPGAYIIKTYAPGEEGNPFKNHYGHRIMDWFRAYDTPFDSFLDHAKLLQTQRYEKAWAVRNDPMACIRAAMSAGYGTDPGYVGKFEKVLAQIKGAARLDAEGGGGHGWILPVVIGTGIVAAGVTAIVTLRNDRRAKPPRRFLKRAA